MIELDDLKIGLKVWWCDAELSCNGKRLNRASKPEEYIISEYNDSWVIIEQVGNKYVHETLFLRNYGSSTRLTFYKNKEECQIAWNTLMLNFIDRIESECQQKKKNIQSKMFKV